ncbi:MAG: hypothetical protein HYW48_06365 [Deltaproteobacteria bacterium]|nr:hypothetical protein [Deltaproteobacteria bacterium]
MKKSSPPTVIPRLDRGIQRQPSSNKLDPAVKPRDDRLVRVFPLFEKKFPPPTVIPRSSRGMTDL